jgi:hypothetical protein
MSIIRWFGYAAYHDLSLSSSAVWHVAFSWGYSAPEMMIPWKVERFPSFSWQGFKVFDWHGL